MNAKRVSGQRRGPRGLIIAGSTGEFGAAYDGSVPFPGSDRPAPTVEGHIRVAVTAAIVLVPFAGLGVAVWLAWGHGLGLADVLLALGFYVLTGLGNQRGDHRLRRTAPARTAAGSRSRSPRLMKPEGDVLGAGRHHRRPHAFTDRPGDPHSPIATAPTW